MQVRASADYRRIQRAVDSIQQPGEPNYVVLSIAAKAYFILERKGVPMSVREIQREAERFNWDIGSDSLRNAVSYLERLNLTRTCCITSSTLLKNGRIEHWVRPKFEPPSEAL